MTHHAQRDACKRWDPASKLATKTVVLITRVHNGQMANSGMTVYACFTMRIALLYAQNEVEEGIAGNGDFEEVRYNVSSAAPAVTRVRYK